MSTIAEFLYHVVERVDGEKSTIRWIGYRKAQQIKVWLLSYIH